MQIERMNRKLCCWSHEKGEQSVRQWTRPLKQLVNFISVVVLFYSFFSLTLTPRLHNNTKLEIFSHELQVLIIRIASLQDEIYSRLLVLSSSNMFYHFVMMMISTQMQTVKYKEAKKIRATNWNASLYIYVMMNLRPNKILFNIKIGFRLDDDDDEFFLKKKTTQCFSW